MSGKWKEYVKYRGRTKQVIIHFLLRRVHIMSDPKGISSFQSRMLEDAINSSIKI